MLDRDQSVRIDLIRFPLIVAVVFDHAWESVLQFGSTHVTLAPDGFAAAFAYNFIGRGMGFAAVLFFFISGFLFFHGLDWSGPAYLKKVRSRAFTLLIPFLFWNVLYLVIYAVAQKLSITSQYFAGGLPTFSELGPAGILNFIFGITRNPVAFQFWFIRDLIVLVLLTPVFHLMHYKRSYLVFLPILFAIWYFGLVSTIPKTQSIFFFYAGSVLAAKQKNPFCTDRYGWAVLLAWLAVISLDTLFPERVLLHNANIGVGVFAALYFSKALLPQRIRQALIWLSAFGFFIFAFHEPFTGFIQRVIVRFYAPQDDITKLLLFFTITFAVIAISIGLNRALGIVFPRFTSIITGGRTTRPKKEVEHVLPSVYAIKEIKSPSE